MRKALSTRVLTLGLLALLCFLPATTALLAQQAELDAAAVQVEVYHEKSVIPGGLLRGAVLLGEEPERMTARLLDAGGGERTRSHGFSAGTAKGKLVWCFLLGLPSTLKGGSYTLAVEGSAGKGSFRYQGEVSVGEQSFLFERVVLSPGVFKLLTERDPRKEEEARQLNALLESFDCSALFHTGVFILPVRAIRTSGTYADRREYLYEGGASALSLHNGIDLAADCGTPVSACAAGRVMLASFRLLSGNTIVLEHLPGVFSLYYHLQSLAVSPGDTVAQGQVVGRVGSTGASTGPHLHWEVRVSAVAVNPLALIDSPLLDKNALIGILESDLIERR